VWAVRNPRGKGSEPELARQWQTTGALTPRTAPKLSYAAQIAEQIAEVRKLLSLGRQNYQIRQVLSVKYGLSDRTIERRIRDARAEQVDELEKLDRKQLAAQLISAAYEILGEARETRQLSNALGALGFMARMTGLETRNN
jgi:hypothetical protein